jgi:GH18 family chitinase
MFVIRLFSYVDMINVMTYDMYGSWTNKIGHHSALFHRHGEKGMERDLNTVRSNEKDFSYSIRIMFHIGIIK